jgi:MFS superfamily sulfate permease-like transporter
MSMSVMVGGIYLLMWALKLGFVVELLSEPCMSGMTTAAAFLICTSQARHLLGVAVPRGGFLQTWFAIAGRLGEAKLACVAIGVASLAAQIALARLNKKLKWRIPIPEQLVVVVLGTAAVALLGLDVPMLGEVPSGLPAPTLPSMARAPELLEGSLVVAVVSIALCIATAKTFAAKNGYDVDPNQELLALGLANLLGGCMQCYPAASSLSRSALANAVGARTQLWNVFCCGVITVVLVALLPLLRTLPNAALAAIILIAFKSILGQLSEVKRLWSLNPPDCLVWLATFFGCLLLGVKLGIAVGVAASVGCMLRFQLRPPFAVLGQLPLTEVYRDRDRYPEALELPGLLLFRYEYYILTVTKILNGCCCLDSKGRSCLHRETSSARHCCKRWPPGWTTRSRCTPSSWPWRQLRSTAQVTPPPLRPPRPAR